MTVRTKFNLRHSNYISETVAAVIVAPMGACSEPPECLFLLSFVKTAVSREFGTKKRSEMITRGACWNSVVNKDWRLSTGKRSDENQLKGRGKLGTTSGVVLA